VLEAVYSTSTIRIYLSAGFFSVLCVVSTDLPCLAVVRFIPWRRSQRGVRFVFFRFVLSRRSTRQVGGGRRQQLTTGLRRRRRRKSLSMRAGTRNCHLSVCSSHTTLACRCADDWYAAFDISRRRLVAAGDRAGFQCVEALGRIIIRGKSGGVLVWLSVRSKVQTTL